MVLLGKFCYNNKALAGRDEQFCEKFGFLFEDVNPKKTLGIYFQFFYVIRTWVSVFLLVVFAKFPYVQVFGLAALNFTFLRFHYWTMPFKRLLWNINLLTNDCMILLCNLLFTGLLETSGETAWFNLLSWIICCMMIGMLAMPIICYITECMQMCFSNKILPTELTKGIAESAQSKKPTDTAQQWISTQEKVVPKEVIEKGAKIEKIIIPDKMGKLEILKKFGKAAYLNAKKKSANNM